MAYDVFVVSALEDRDMANLVVRRLRALKFKCWFDKKQTDNTFDQKDARNALNSQSMLVLWSKHAVKSDWVRAAASVGHSRPGMLIEIGLDDTIPYEPFAISKRHMLEGMTTRTTVEGFYEVVEELGRRDGRTDLRTWMNYGKDDESLKQAWLENHPADPLAIADAKKRERELERSALTSGAATAGAAASAGSAASALTGTEAAATGSGAPASAVGANTSSTSSPNDGVIGSGYGEGVGKVPGTPGAPYKPGRKGPAGVSTAAPIPVASSASAAPATTTRVAPVTAPVTGINRWMVPGILAAIAAMLLIGWAVRSSPILTHSPSSGGIASLAGSGGAGKGEDVVMAGNSCPAGYISLRTLAVVPETDTKEDEEE